MVLVEETFFLYVVYEQVLHSVLHTKVNRVEDEHWQEYPFHKASCCFLDQIRPFPYKSIKSVSIPQSHMINEVNKACAQKRVFHLLYLMLGIHINQLNIIILC